MAKRKKKKNSELDGAGACLFEAPLTETDLAATEFGADAQPPTPVQY